MQTVVISIVTCDVCIIYLHASAENCLKVSTLVENINHDTSWQWTNAMGRCKPITPLLYTRKYTKLMHGLFVSSGGF